ncbi:MAG: poly(R)-hydroxyalkanoic acid synthase subunit PhaE [Desulforhopalus sp.]
MANTTGQKKDSGQVNDFGKLVESWMDMAQAFWKDVGAKQEEGFSGIGLNFDFDTGNDGADENKYKTYKTWEASVNNFNSIVKIMMAPENQENVSKGILAFTEGLAEAAGESLENFAEFQGQIVKSFTKVGEQTKAYNFDNLDRTAFESFRDLYKTEFQKYLHIPKIGLPREFHEQLSQLTDKSNIFSSYLVELFYLFTLPFEKTNRVMQQKVKQMLENGEFAEDSKQVYSEWIKILEGHFMELLKSREYTEVLNNTITSFAAYKSVKSDVIDVFLKELQIPTTRDMDEVYKDLYQMKKKIRALSRQVEELQNGSKA